MSLTWFRAMKFLTFSSQGWWMPRVNLRNIVWRTCPNIRPKEKAWRDGDQAHLSSSLYSRYIILKESIEIKVREMRRHKGRSEIRKMIHHSMEEFSFILSSYFSLLFVINDDSVSSQTSPLLLSSFIRNELWNGTSLTKRRSSHDHQTRNESKVSFDAFTSSTQFNSWSKKLKTHTERNRPFPFLHFIILSFPSPPHPTH